MLDGNGTAWQRVGRWWHPSAGVAKRDWAFLTASGTYTLFHEGTGQ